MLAYHYAESTRPTKAVPYLIAAAENVARRCAHDTAIEHYRRAMALLPDQPGHHSDEFFRVRLGLGRAGVAVMVVVDAEAKRHAGNVADLRHLPARSARSRIAQQDRRLVGGARVRRKHRNVLRRGADRSRPSVHVEDAT